MKYRDALNSDRMTDPNEARADDAEFALKATTDRNGEDEPNGVFTDVSDLLAHVVHFCARAGIDFEAVVDHAAHAAQGDLEDGPEAARDTDRFPAEVPA